MGVTKLVLVKDSCDLTDPDAWLLRVGWLEPCWFCNFYQVVPGNLRCCLFWKRLLLSNRTTLPSGITLTAKLMANELRRQNRNNERVKESLQHIQLVA